MPSLVGVPDKEKIDQATKAAPNSGSELDVPYTVSVIGSLIISCCSDRSNGIRSPMNDSFLFLATCLKIPSEYPNSDRQCNLKAYLQLTARHLTGMCDCVVPDNVEYYLSTGRFVHRFLCCTVEP